MLRLCQHGYTGGVLQRRTQITHDVTQDEPACKSTELRTMLFRCSEMYSLDWQRVLQMYELTWKTSGDDHPNNAIAHAEKVPFAKIQPF